MDDEAPDPHLFEALERLRDHGKNRLVVFSARAVEPGGCAAIWGWLATHKIDHHFVKVTHEKPAAAVYIDDRAYRHEGDWQATAIDVLALQRAAE